MKNMAPWRAPMIVLRQVSRLFVVFAVLHACNVAAATIAPDGIPAKKDAHEGSVAPPLSLAIASLATGDPDSSITGSPPNDGDAEAYQTTPWSLYPAEVTSVRPQEATNPGQKVAKDRNNLSAGARQDIPPRTGEISALQLLAIAGGAALLRVFVAYWRAGSPGRRIMNWFDAKALGVRRIMGVEDIDSNDLLTPADVHNRGWSMDLMVDVLGPPDYAVVDPIGRSPPLVFVSRRRVEALENDKDVRLALRQLDGVTEAALRKWMQLRDGYVTYAEAPPYGAEPRR